MTLRITRTTTVSIRLKSRTRYALELLARKRHHSLTSVIEWALERAIYDAVEGLFDIPVGERGKPESIVDKVWDTDESDRLVKLSMYFPRLLTFEEEKLVKAIRENSRLWSAKDGPNYKAIRSEWPKLKAQYLQEGS